MDRLRRFARRSPVEQRSLVTVAFLLAVIRLGLAIVPFGTLRRTLDRVAGSPKPDSRADPGYLSRVYWATNIAGRYVLRDKPCLTQALTVRFLLRRKGIPADLRIGIMKNDDKELLAHAWVECNGDVVIGGPRSELGKYTLMPDLDMERL